MDLQAFRLINGLAGHSVWVDRSLVLVAVYAPLLFVAVLVRLWGIREEGPQRRQDRLAVGRALVAAALALGLGQLIIRVYPRPRPFVAHAVRLLIPLTVDPSFPSDHALAAFAIAAALISTRRRLGIGLFALGALLAFARVFVGTHYPLDVLGGAILGAACGTLLHTADGWVGTLVRAVARWTDAAAAWGWQPRSVQRPAPEAMAPPAGIPSREQLGGAGSGEAGVLDHVHARRPKGARGRNMLTRLLYRIYERRLLAEVRQHTAPRHLGLIQDGHRRYCRQAGLPDLEEGYRLGGNKAAEVLGWCSELGIPLVTLWWLSTENLVRQPQEVAAVLRVIEAKVLEWSEGGLAQRLGMRMCPIGKLDLLPTSTQEALQTAERATRGLDRMALNVAVGYGGRQEIIDAIRSYLRHAAMQGLPLEEITSNLSLESLDRHMYTHDCPDPDLIIRTSGEVRLSGFMLWQSAYSEFYFCDAYWPAFRKIDFLRAIRSYQQRGRRYGK